MSRSIRFQLVVLISSMISVGCGGFKGRSVLSQSSLSDPECKTVSSFFSDESKPQSLFDQYGKVVIQANSYKQNSALMSTAETDFKLPAGQTLAVVVNEKCIKDQPNENAIIRALISINENSPQEEVTFNVELPEQVFLSDVESDVENDPCIIGVGDAVEYTLMQTPNDTHFGSQSHLRNIRAASGWDTFHGAQGIDKEVIVAIIDSGVDIDHPDLMANIWSNPDEISGNGVDDDVNGKIDDTVGWNFASNSADPNPQEWPADPQGRWTPHTSAHGTHVAGLTAARTNNSLGVAGVMAANVKIMSLNVFGANPNASNPNVENAIRYAADKGAHIINMSLGGATTTLSSSMSSALSYALSKGVVIIAAAGNSNLDIRTNLFSPASFGQQYQGMLTIGAIDASNSSKCDFSNYSNSYVELVAPGCDTSHSSRGILSTYAHEWEGHYAYMAGTSMASPVAAGGAALTYAFIWSRTGSKPNPATVEQEMIAGSRVETSLTSYFKDGKALDLVTLANRLNSRYPAGSPDPDPSPNPSPAPCVK